MNIREALNTYASDLTPEQHEKFAIYADMLVKWNEERCNLTAITEPAEIVQKHFLDSCLPKDLIQSGAKCIDVGTGAGFPGVPLLIMRPDIKLTLVDSLNKRVDFLIELTKTLGMEANCIHARAEDAGRMADLRGRFDIALTRAVSQANILLEWTSPFLKVGGKSLMYKSASADEELSTCKNALRELGMRAEIKRYPAQWGERSVICAEQIKKTPEKYPRKAGTAKKQPL